MQPADLNIDILASVLVPERRVAKEHLLPHGAAAALLVTGSQ
jgi:hypothetical protein